MPEKIAFIGGGGHALSLLDILPSPLKAAGYVDFTANPDMPLPYLGDDNRFIDTCPAEDWEVVLTFVSGPSCDLSTRSHIINKYAAYASPVIIAPSAIVSRSAEIGGGTAVFHRAVINARSSVGRHSVINTGAIIEHGCRLGENVFIGPGVIVCGEVSIGDDTYVGAGAIFKPGVKIASGSIIGAGTVVTRDIIVPGTYVGSPARHIR